jgi:uncharacterized coiled-coil DUF342 family protein
MRTIEQINQEYTQHAALAGDIAFKKNKLNSELNKYHSKMDQLVKEADALKAEEDKKKQVAALVKPPLNEVREAV